MKLSELIAYRNKLLQYDVTDIAYNARHKLSDVVYTVKNTVIQLRTYTQTIEEDLDNVVDVFDQFDKTLSGLIQELGVMIEAAEKKYYADSTKDYGEWAARYGTLGNETNNQVNQTILDRQLVMSIDTQKMLADRIK